MKIQNQHPDTLINCNGNYLAFAKMEVLFSIHFFQTPTGTY